MTNPDQTEARIVAWLRTTAARLLYATGSVLYRAGSTLMLASERLQGDGDGPWSSIGEQKEPQP